MNVLDKDNITAIYIKSIREDLNIIKKMDKLDKREIARAIRDAIIDEQDAIKQYEIIVDSVSDVRVKKILQNIADEEKVHVGELQGLLEEYDSDEATYINQGRREITSQRSGDE